MLEFSRTKNVHRGGLTYGFMCRHYNNYNIISIIDDEEKRRERRKRFWVHLSLESRAR